MKIYRGVNPFLLLRFSLSLDPEIYNRVYSASAFTFPLIPIISNENPKHIEFYQWGLIPFWVKDNHTGDKIRQRTLNARAETIFEKPAFRHSIRNSINLTNLTSYNSMHIMAVELDLSQAT